MWYLPGMRSVPYVVTVLIALTASAAAAPAAKAPVAARSAVKVAAKAATPTVTATPTSARDELIVEYQRVGHEVVLLQNLRGRDAAQELWATLHSIDLDKDLATPDGCATTALTLAELHDRIDRRRGVDISKACQDNPIANDCQ